MTDAVVVHPNESRLARVDPQALIAQAIEKGAGIDTVERLVALAKDLREVQAREAWYAAIAEFQRLCPPIFKERVGKTASYSYKYASIDDVLGVIQPVMGPLGLSVSWKLRFQPDAAGANCRISHSLGHFEESGEVLIPIEKSVDGKGATPAQRVGIAMTYAQRYALKAAAGVTPTDAEDTDGAETGPAQPDRREAPVNGGEVISEGQARRFYAIARGVKPAAWSDEQITKLLNEHSHEHVKEITTGEYEAIVDILKRGPKVAA